MKKLHLLLFLLVILPFQLLAQKPRARDLGIPFDGITGTNNAITDVPGVEVGYKTLIMVRVN